MSDLAKARRQVTSVRTLMRQGKHLPAIQALYDTVLAMIKNPLMKSERDEFERMVTDATYHIMGDNVVRTSAALEISYTPGQERELLDGLRILLEAFQGHMQQEAADGIRRVTERRAMEVERGQALLDAEDFDGARGIFAAISSEAGHDGTMRADIGERFLKARQYADAAVYLGAAIELSPESIHLYNSLAMAQRKLGNYADAEQCYLKAAQAGARDPHLLFNMGRLYLDWEKWEKACKAAQGALTIEPSFEEARKLMVYAEKMLHKKAVARPGGDFDLLQH